MLSRASSTAGHYRVLVCVSVRVCTQFVLIYDGDCDNVDDDDDDDDDDDADDDNERTYGDDDEDDDDSGPMSMKDNES